MKDDFVYLHHHYPEFLQAGFQLLNILHTQYVNNRFLQKKTLLNNIYPTNERNCSASLSTMWILCKSHLHFIWNVLSQDTSSFTFHYILSPRLLVVCVQDRFCVLKSTKLRGQTQHREPWFKMSFHTNVNTTKPANCRYRVEQLGDVMSVMAGITSSHTDLCLV